MKLPVKWINESFKKDYSSVELSDLLTLSGIESEIEREKNEEILGFPHFFLFQFQIQFQRESEDQTAQPNYSLS